jgi:peptidyl-prolyl cis-trans isomerase SurA
MNNFRLLILCLCFALPATAQKGVVIDKIIASVADKVILMSDIENQMTLMGITGEDRVPARCEMLDQMIAAKLLTIQAVLDSIPVGEDEVEEDLDRKINYYIRMVGSQEKFEEYYNKTVEEIKADFRDDIREQLFAQRMRSKILEKTSVTPSEVRAFFNAIPKDSLPYIPKEMEVSQIVIKAKVSQEQRKAAIEKITDIRKRLLEGESFEFLANLYSEDPGSAVQGGELGLAQRGSFVPSFESAAFRLKKGDISDIVETEFGFHVLELIDRKGEFINVRHILIKPRVLMSDLVAAKEILDSAKYKIENKQITFLDAVKRYSEDEISKNAGGRILNPRTGGTLLAAEEMDPSLFFTIDTLPRGVVSGPYPFIGQDGSQGFRLVRLDDLKEAHVASFEEDYDKIHEVAKEEKEARIVMEWLQKRAKRTFISVDEDYNDCTTLQSWLK